jgi:hypothetical protein
MLSPPTASEASAATIYETTLKKEFDVTQNCVFDQATSIMLPRGNLSTDGQSVVCHSSAGKKEHNSVEGNADQAGSIGRNTQGIVCM